MQAIYEINLDSETSQRVFAELSTTISAKINNIEKLSQNTDGFIVLRKGSDFVIKEEKYTTTLKSADNIIKEKIIAAAIANKSKNIELDVSDFDFSKIVAEIRVEEEKMKEKEGIKREMIELANKRGIKIEICDDNLNFVYTKFTDELSEERKYFMFDANGLQELQDFDVEAHKKKIHDRLDAESAAKQKEKDEEEKYARDKREWISANGSETLQKGVAQGYNCEKRYFEERLEKEAGADYDTLDNDEEVKSRSCPSAKALAELERAQKIDKNAKIVWVVEDYCDEEAGERFDDSYEAIELEFLQRKVYKRIV